MKNSTDSIHAGFWKRVFAFINTCIQNEEFAREQGVRAVYGKVQGLEINNTGQVFKFAVDKDGIALSSVRNAQRGN